MLRPPCKKPENDIFDLQGSQGLFHYLSHLCKAGMAQQHFSYVTAPEMQLL